MINNYLRSASALAQQLANDGVSDQRVLEVIAKTPRHLFIDDVLQHKAYDNTALPIGQGQTISQPFIVAQMTALLLHHGITGKVLEIGTGSGYQSAILAQLFDQVFSVERIKALQYQAKRRLHKLDLYNVSMKHGDGWQGWQSQAPFQGIIVTAAAATVPQALLEQLDDGGILIVPVGDAEQKLMLYTRQDNQFKQQVMADVRFVPLVPGEIL